MSPKNEEGAVDVIGSNIPAHTFRKVLSIIWVVFNDWKETWIFQKYHVLKSIF